MTRMRVGLLKESKQEEVNYITHPSHMEKSTTRIINREVMHFLSHRMQLFLRPLLPKVKRNPYITCLIIMRDRPQRPKVLI